MLPPNLSPTPHGSNGSGNVRQPLLFETPLDGYPGDICQGRHHGAETSILAHDRVRPFKRAVYDQLLDLIQARGPDGATVHELAEALGKYPSAISGRLTELRTLGKVKHRRDGDDALVKRRGAAVLVLVEC